MKNSLNERLVKLARLYFKKKLPVIPLNGKAAYTSGWTKHSEVFPTKDEIRYYLSEIKSSIGLVLGKCSGLIAVDIDSTNEEELAIIHELLPESPIVKIGKKGETRFYRFNGEGRRKVKTKNGMAIELLSSGNQTVLPPSIHPDTQKPYRYKDYNYTLLRYDLSKLPVLPDDVFDEIQRRLKGTKSILPQKSLSPTNGRNDQLKSMAVAMLCEGKKSLKEIATELYEYDRLNHSPPLFSDKSEGVYITKKPLYNALGFTANIQDSIKKHGLTENYTPSEDIEILSLGEYCEPDRFPPLNPIVEGLINHEELHLLTAPAKAGKTVLQLNLAVAVARGGRFLNHETHKGKVLIIQTEVGPSNFRNRLLKVIGEKGLDDIKNSIFISSNRVRLDTPAGLVALEKTIKQYYPSLLILDPFYTLHQIDEDKSSAVAPVLSNLRDIVIRTKIACLLIHHQGKGGGGASQVGHKARGSSSFADVPDGSWSMSKGSDPKTATLSFELRNVETPLPIQLILDENLTWQSNGFANETNNLTIDSIADFLSEEGELSAGELVSRLEQLHGVSKRTIQNKIKLSEDAGKIQGHRKGKNKFYSSAKEQSLDTEELHRKKISADVKSVGTAHLHPTKKPKNQDVKMGGHQ